jgi:hypothetical protein
MAESLVTIVFPAEVEDDVLPVEVEDPPSKRLELHTTG